MAMQYTAENAEEAYLTLLRGPNVSSAMTSLTEPLRESRRSNFRSACWPASSVWLLALMKDLEVAMLSGLESEWHAALLVLKLHCLFNLVPSSPIILFVISLPHNREEKCRRIFRQYEKCDVKIESFRWTNNGHFSLSKFVLENWLQVLFGH